VIDQLIIERGLFLITQRFKMVEISIIV